MPRLRALWMLTFLATCPGAEPAWAQRAWVSGTVVDHLRAPLAYANVIIEGSMFGAMTDSSGAYRLELVPGRHTLRVLMMGFEAEQRTLSVDLGGHATVDVILTRDDTRGHNTLVGAGKRAPGTPPLAADSLQSMPLGVYPASSEPVRCGPLELVLGYSQVEVGDSVITRVIATRRNVSEKKSTACGCFSFWKVGYGFGPEVLDSIPLGGASHYRGPVLDVGPRECNGPVLSCDPVELEPGETDSRELRFAFRPRDFKDWTGEVNVTCIYFHGEPGAPWVDTGYTLLTQMPFGVPVRPVGMPYQPR